MEQYPAKVIKVIDGDSIVVEVNMVFFDFELRAKKLYVRLKDIDAPEKTGTTKRAGLEAQAFLESLILNESVVIETEKKDDFGRWLSNVYFRAWKINDLMLEKGYAVPYVR